MDSRGTVFRPSDGSTVLSYDTAPRLKYRARHHKEMERAVHAPDLKSLVNDVSFLTEKAMAGDVVIYAGNNIGHWFPIVARMFPTLHFLVYDGNPVKLGKIVEQHDIEKRDLPPNVSIKHCWFSEFEARRFATTGDINARDGILLIADTNNIAYDKNAPGPVFKVTSME